MLVIASIIGGVSGLVIGGMIRTSLAKNKCNHKWEIIKDGDIVNYNRCGEKMVVGFMKVYECEHCKELYTKKTYVN